MGTKGLGKMKKLAQIVLVSMVIMSLAVPMAYAKKGDSSPFEYKPTKEERQQEREEKKQERVALKLEGLKARVSQYIDRRAAVYGTVTTGLLRKVDRVEAIADKVAATGADCTEVYTLLDKARVSITESQVSEEEVLTLYAELANATTLKDARGILKEARMNGMQVGKNLKSARNDLKQAVRALKALAVKTDGEDSEETTDTVAPPVAEVPTPTVEATTTE